MKIIEVHKEDSVHTVIIEQVMLCYAGPIVDFLNERFGEVAIFKAASDDYDPKVGGKVCRCHGLLVCPALGAKPPLSVVDEDDGA